MRRFLLAVCIVVVSAGASGAITLTDRMHSHISKGNGYYRDDEHEQALERYQRAEAVDSAHSVPYFNAGDALYRLGRFPDGARKFLKSASSPTDSIASMSYYNLGNSLFKAGDPRAAADAYKRSLLINPDDEDAKHNLEYVLKVIEEQEQQQQERPDQSQEELAKDKGQDDQQEQQDQQQQDQQQEQDQEQQQQPQEQQQDQQQDQQQPQEGQPPPGEISPEDLERILAAIEASDKNTQEEMLKKASRRKRITGKDW